MAVWIQITVAVVVVDRISPDRAERTPVEFDSPNRTRCKQSRSRSSWRPPGTGSGPPPWSGDEARDQQQVAWLASATKHRFNGPFSLPGRPGRSYQWTTSVCLRLCPSSTRRSGRARARGGIVKSLIKIGDELGARLQPFPSLAS